jgi:hypothetical protein
VELFLLRRERTSPLQVKSGTGCVGGVQLRVFAEAGELTVDDALLDGVSGDAHHGERVLCRAPEPRGPLAVTLLARTAARPKRQEATFRLMSSSELSASAPRKRVAASS